MQCTIDYLNQLLCAITKQLHTIIDSQERRECILKLQSMLQEYELCNVNLIQQILHCIMVLLQQESIKECVEWIMNCMEQLLIPNMETDSTLLQQNLKHKDHKSLYTILNWIELNLQNETMEWMNVLELMLRECGIICKTNRNFKSKMERVFLKLTRIARYHSIKFAKNATKEIQQLLYKFVQLEILFVEVWKKYELLQKTPNNKQYFVIAMNCERVRKSWKTIVKWMQQENMDTKEIEEIGKIRLEWMPQGMMIENGEGEEAVYYELPKRNQNTLFRSRNTYIDEALAIEGGDETYADLEDFIVTSDEDIV